MDQNPEGQGQKSVVGNNQPNPTPAAPSGAIFSGSSAPTGTAPAGTPNQPTSDRSRPFFSHHPAHTFSREMGDIVVGSTGQPKKSRKKDGALEFDGVYDVRHARTVRHVRRRGGKREDKADSLRRAGFAFRLLRHRVRYNAQRKTQPQMRSYGRGFAGRMPRTAAKFF